MDEFECKRIESIDIWKRYAFKVNARQSEREWNQHKANENSRDFESFLLLV